MKLDSIIRVKELFPGIQRISHEIGAHELVALVGALAAVRALPTRPARRSESGVVNLFEADGVTEIALRLHAVNEEDFVRFCATPGVEAGFAAVLRGQRQETLLSFLKDRGGRSLSTLTKEDMVAQIIASPRILFKALAGVARGWGYDLKSSRRIGDPGDGVYYLEHSITTTSARRLDFWQVSWEHERESGSLEFTTRSEENELAAIPANAAIRLSWRAAKAPPLEFAGATADLKALKIHDIAEEHGVKAATMRDETIKRVIAKYDDPKRAAAIDGKRLYISFDAPLLIGKPLATEELFALAPYIKFQGSAEKVFEATIDAQGKRTDFQHYFRAKPKCWAVFAEVSVS